MDPMQTSVRILRIWGGPNTRFPSITSLTCSNVNVFCSIANEEWIDLILLSLRSVGFGFNESYVTTAPTCSPISITRFVISSVIVNGG